jgi:hypothetical protein
MTLKGNYKKPKTTIHVFIEICDHVIPYHLIQTSTFPYHEQPISCFSLRARAVRPVQTPDSRICA